MPCADSLPRPLARPLLHVRNMSGKRKAIRTDSNGDQESSDDQEEISECAESYDDEDDSSEGATSDSTLNITDEVGANCTHVIDHVIRCVYVYRRCKWISRQDKYQRMIFMGFVGFYSRYV